MRYLANIDSRCTDVIFSKHRLGVYGCDMYDPDAIFMTRMRYFASEPVWEWNRLSSHSSMRLRHNTSHGSFLGPPHSRDNPLFNLTKNFSELACIQRVCSISRKKRSKDNISKIVRMKVYICGGCGGRNGLYSSELALHIKEAWWIN